LSDGIEDFAIFLLDPSGHVVTWNRGAQEIKGYEAAEIIGRHFSCFYLEEDIQRGKPQYLLQVATTKGSVEDEGWRVRKDGARFWGSVLITALKAPGGQLRGFAKVVRDLTERKRAEEAQAFQGEVIRNMADGVVVIRDGDGAIVYTNPRFEEMFGYDQGELIGQHISIVNAHDEQSPEEVAREILAKLDKEGTWTGEVHNVKKDGATLWSHVSVSAFNHPEYGDVWVSVQTDITQRKEAEEALRESETRYRSLVEAANSAIVTSDEDGRIISWNRGALDIFGYTHEEALGQLATFLVPERHRGTYQRALIRAVEAGKDNLPGKPLEFHALKKDSSEFPIELSLFSWRAGSRRFFSAIIQDITGRKRAEQDRIRLRELAREEEERRRLQTLIDSSPVGVMVVDARTQRLVLVNREAQRLRGDSYQLGKPLSECGPDITHRRPDGREWEMADLPLRRALSYGETVRAEEVTMEFPDGHTIPTLVNATPVYSEAGHIVSAIAIIQDLTPLQELEKLRNEFLGMVTHELRTPLSTIKGAAATGLRSRIALRPGESQEFFQIIEEQVDHLTDLVNNLLDMTSIEAGVFAVAVEPTDLPSILEEAIADFRRIQGNCLVECQIPSDLPRVDADRRRIIQVLTNLLDNAARFSPPGSPIIVKLEHEGGYVTVHVRDSGPGIPEGKLPYLFKKFTRIDENSVGSNSGFGLGLAICQGIVEAHGGRIWATSSQEGTGTTISFTLVEAVDVNTPFPEAPSLEGVTVEGTGAPGERFKILAVDDDQNALRFLRRLLEGAGYLPIMSSDPGEVLEIVEAQRPDLVLLDVILPQVNGLDLMKSIREYSNVPVIFLTARDSRDDMINALKAGGDDYITKPFSESELLARVEVILRRKARNGNVGTTILYDFDGLTIDFDQRRVTADGREVSLSATEYKLICELAQHAGRVMTHDQILQLVWGRDYYGETELVRSMVRRLRNKLGDNAQDPRYIFTVAQVGYRMASPQPSAQ
jgi:PAS domain S-box-containing protein